LHIVDDNVANSNLFEVIFGTKREAKATRARTRKFAATTKVGSMLHAIRRRTTTTKETYKQQAGARASIPHPVASIRVCGSAVNKLN